MSTTRVTAGACLAVLLALAVIPASAGNKLEIVTMSNQPNKVSGGDVLVSVHVPSGTRLGDVRITLNGRDVTGAVSADPANHVLVGLVTGMKLRKNRLGAEAQGPRPDQPGIQNQ